MKGHQLRNRTLTRDHDGIKAECECGWISRGHFTSLAASAAHSEHQEKVLADITAAGQPEGGGA